MNEPAEQPGPRRPRAWGMCGIILALLFLLLAVAMNTVVRVAVHPASDVVRQAQDQAWYLARLITFLAAGLVYGASLLLLPRASGTGSPDDPGTRRAAPAQKPMLPIAGLRNPKRLLLLIVLVAVAMRLPAFWIPGKNGLDYNRYLWDGAVVAHGHNPYQYTPEQILQDNMGDQTIRNLVAQRGSGVLDQTAFTGGAILARCNHPDHMTPYPPLAQVCFALGYVITPFNLTGWRLVLLLFDVLAALAVLALLRSCGLPTAWWAAYLWNPIIVEEIYIDAHLEMVVAAGLILFAWCLCRRRFMTAAVVLAAAAAVKIWPAALIVFIVRPAWGHKWRLLLALAVFGVVTASLLLPQRLATAGAKREAAANYLWSSHDNFGVHYFALTAEEFLRKEVPLIDDLGRWIEQEKGLPAGSDALARIFGYLLPWLAFLVWMALRPWKNSYELCCNMGLTMLLFWLLAPTNYPWYFVTVLVFGAVTLRPALLAWSLLLPLAHMAMAFENQPPQGAFWLFVHQHALLMWAIHLPVWVLLLLEACNVPRRWRDSDPQSDSSAYMQLP